MAWTKSGNRVRLQLSTNVEPKDNGRLIKGKAILEIENSQTPALVAETPPLVVP